jgi:hypothetical protein
MRESVKLKACGLYLRSITNVPDTFLIYTTSAKLFLKVKFLSILRHLRNVMFIKTSLQNYLTTASKRTLLTRALLLNGRSLDTKIFVASDAFRPETLTLEQIASAEYQNRKWKR